ncbi:hypothetical protein A2954_03125 [Candidatus Roizmanbacteria bacterium RIFCSPLOWO2_01_FULL_37_12]|uniref:Elongation factor Ts n=1 Tax=Candidatus Roizmanbacteria bacterium RIFCSPLOWO2_01_FULL_37_12 TaxID=1802056 RepID=A0A1F7IAJ1_9BACT|nr:MAG: hypothetical protein A3D76_04215 [Candidatus Roizmanbacteria bacterium RIFCSPHIGHO2_02_FULL_37_9b]OGK40367.1 MAG: hypothetical protein A2954_03125 [Candidatus Roizmanbacteria bacterium RIFCSPLOWO2_01_FULL_37_12]
MLDINKLKQLRNETGISIALCKKALEETSGDLKKAKNLLNKWGIEKNSDKNQRTTSQGSIFSYIHHNGKIAGFVELLSETDFVSNNADFQKLGKEITLQVASLPAKTAGQLLKQDYIRDPGKKISDLINEAVLKFGENIKIGKILRWELGK